MLPRLCRIQSQLLCSSALKHLVYSPNKFHGIVVEPSVRNKYDVSFRTIRIGKGTTAKFEDNPKVIELEKTLQCTKPEAVRMYVHFLENSIQIDLKKINNIMKWLHRLGAEISIILENCHLFLVPKSKICN